MRHWGSALMLIATAAAGLGAVVPAVMMHQATLRLAPLPTADLAIAFSKLAASPAEVQASAVDTLSGVLLMLAVGAAVVCTLTVIALCVSRSSARRAEFTLRRAVGASRKQLVSGVLAEGGVMAITAAILGIGASLIVIRVALAAWPGTAGPPGIYTVVLGALVASAILLIGAALPTFSVGRMPVTAHPSAVPPGLTVAGVQLAISFAVLLAAAQIGDHARGLIGDDGVEARGRGQILQLDTAGTPAERAGRLADLIRQSGLADFLDVMSVTSPGALEGLGTIDVAITDCGRCSQGGIATPQRAVAVAISVVSPDTFRAMNVRLIEGRAIAAGDDWTAPRAVVVNHALASAHFQDGRAVGRHIQIGEGPNNWFKVVGVVEDTQPVALGGALEPPYAVYGSVLQLPPSTVDVLVRPRAGLRVPDGWLRTALQQVGTISRVVTEEQWWADAAAPLRWFAIALWIGGALILVQAIFGTGVATHLWVAALLPELAMRRAVGARRRDVLLHVLSRAVVVATVAVALGLVLNDLTSGPLGSLIPGVPGIDVAASGRLALVLVVAALAGALIPAWRASRAQPAALAALL
jgi:putative ABC transport system permease protein